MFNLFKEQLSVRRILQVMSDISEYDLDFEIIRSDVTIIWYKDTFSFDNVKIVKLGRNGEMMCFAESDVTIEIFIYDNDKELLVYKSNKYDIFEGAEVQLQRIEGSRAINDEVIKWIHKGPWCNFIESKIQELERQIANAKHKMKQETNKQNIEQQKQKNEVINHFDKIFSKRI